MAQYQDLDTRGCMPDDLTDEELEDLADIAKDYLVSHGLNMRNPKRCAPVTLFPYPVPEECYNKACQVQQSFNSLFHQVANDYEFLEMCMSQVIKVDEFTRKLWDIYEAVNKEEILQNMSLRINRSDYMMTMGVDGCQHIRQLEINTIHAAGATAGCIVTDCNKYILQTTNMSEWVEKCGDRLYTSESDVYGRQIQTSKVDPRVVKVPDNKAVSGLTEGLEAAWRYYNNSKAVILFVVEYILENRPVSSYDQIMLDYFNKDIKVIRKTLTDMHRLSLEGADRKLFIDGQEVAVLYYNFPIDVPYFYTCKKDWTARLEMERSFAIKCTDIGGQMAGMKKVQQVLSEPGMLERFLSDPEEIKLIRDTFTGHYSLNTSSSGDLAIKKARKNPNQYVIKPQREGGGNNIFGDDIPQLLNKIEYNEERNGYVMMDRIKSLSSRNVVVKPLPPIVSMDVVGELGIFGALLGSAHQVLLNTCCGYLMKCKPEGDDEGGISSCNGSLSSVLLV